MRRLSWLIIAATTAAFAAPRTCVSPEDAAKRLNKDTCIAAHVYDVVELRDGTRFLDVCSPETPDEYCRFSIVSLRQDRAEVGDLKGLLGQDIRIRGTVRPFSGRSEMVLNHARQLHGGAEKFRPNPALLKGFSAEDGKPAFSDPALHGGRHRSIFLSTQPQ